MELRELRGGNGGNGGGGGGGGAGAPGTSGSAGNGSGNGAPSPELGGICIGGAAGGQRMPTKADIFMEQLNATNAKKVALLLVLGFIVYHGLLNWNYGGSKVTNKASHYIHGFTIVILFIP